MRLGAVDLSKEVLEFSRRFCLKYGSRQMSSPVTRHFLFVAIWLISHAVAVDLSSAATLPAGFTETIIPGPSGGAWSEVVGLTFENNGRMYVWERTGQVWFKDTNDASFSLLLDIREEVGAWNDYGMLGFALDPNFRLNGYIYLLYVVDRHHLLHYGTPSYDPSANEYFEATIGRLTRYTCRSADGFRSVDPASRAVLVGETKQTGFPLSSDTHGVGSLVFGEDGTLLVSCGDGASSCSARACRCLAAAPPSDYRLPPVGGCRPGPSPGTRRGNSRSSRWPHR